MLWVLWLEKWDYLNLLGSSQFHHESQMLDIELEVFCVCSTIFWPCVLIMSFVKKNILYHCMLKVCDLFYCFIL